MCKIFIIYVVKFPCYFIPTLVYLIYFAVNITVSK
jgi:hypothetical protein